MLKCVLQHADYQPVHVVLGDTQKKYGADHPAETPDLFGDFGCGAAIRLAGILRDGIHKMRRLTLLTSSLVHSACHKSSVHYEQMASDVTGCVGSQENRSTHKFFQLSEASHGNSYHVFIAAGGAVEHGGIQSVRKTPGTKAFTQTPCRAHSIARLLDSDTTAALLAV